MQRPAKPCTPVRFRLQPPIQLLNMLEDIKKEYPNPYKNLNIYEATLRKKYHIKKPIVKRRKYIYGYLDTDLSNPKDMEIQINSIPGVVENGIFAIRKPNKVLTA